MAQRRPTDGGRQRRTVENTAGKRRSRHLDEVTEIDWRDYNLLEKFVTEHGKILPTRMTGTTAKQQRQLKRAVRRARAIGLLP